MRVNESVRDDDPDARRDSWRTRDRAMAEYLRLATTADETGQTRLTALGLALGRVPTLAEFRAMRRRSRRRRRPPP